MTMCGWTCKLISTSFVLLKKWLGCCLCLPKDQDADVELHLSAAARAFRANKWILCDKHVPIELRIKYFEAVVTPVACFGAGHRKIYQHQLHKFDVEWRRLLRTLLHAVTSDFAQLEPTCP